MTQRSRNATVWWQRLAWVAVLLVFLAALALGQRPDTTQPTNPPPATSSPATPKGTHSSPLRGNLPPQAHATYALIVQGGPFPYDKDGTVFGNRERLLPAQQRGYYREYTVPTPGQRNRGARRIVCGGWQAAQPDACYYTSDHYQSFQPISP